jgi:hypothetical protein
MIVTDELTGGPIGPNGRGKAHSYISKGGMEERFSTISSTVAEEQQGIVVNGSTIGFH